MKQFLYLDTDIINSVIAQKQKGLVTQQTTEEEKSASNSSANSKSLTGDASASSSVFKFVEAMAKLDGELSTTQEKEQSETKKSIIEKTLHDAAFDLAYEIINPTKVVINAETNNNEGCYIELKRTFDFIDLDYLQNLFVKDGMVDLLKKSEAESIEKTAEQFRNSLNRKQERNNASNVAKNTKEIVKENNKKYDDIGIAIKAIRGFLPYNRMLMSSDGYLIPLDDKYFRIDARNLGFKYGGELNCVGMITNCIGKAKNKTDSPNAFTQLQNTANDILINLLQSQADNLWVVHPIAVYYER